MMKKAKDFIDSIFKVGFEKINEVDLPLQERVAAMDRLVNLSKLDDFLDDPELEAEIRAIFERVRQKEKWGDRDR